MRRFPRALLLAAIAAAFTGTLAVAGEKGWFGFAIVVDVEGTPLNPKLRTIKVESVLPASPAASAGISPGDLFLVVEGISVEGANAYTLKTAMQKSVGESLHLKIKHGTDAPRDVVLTAAAKPSK
jgi:C-terminal processing protease CtpA/Prc